MKILPLGGAGEVGASSYQIELAGARILIDAGIRVSSGARGRPLPAFRLLDRAPDALVVTHAHTDHTGALPLVLDHIGDASIHMTTASLHLLEVLQGDAVRNMEDALEMEGDGERVSYTIEQVERAIARVEPHPFFERFCPVPGRSDIIFQYAPSGHILGAGALIIDTPERRILWSGDYSVAPLPTIGGLDLEWIRRAAAERPFDLLVSEGTYGAEVHPPREVERERFIRLLEKVARRGGPVLIPAFAVGRAQDIVKVIREAKLAGRLEGVPLYIDGMCRPITSIYENIAHEIYPSITEPLVLLDPDLGIYKANSQSRAKILAGDVQGPLIVVSSSGMLTGGRSVAYARAFAQNRRAAILISGYTDDESPGRALLSLRRGGKLRLGEDRVRVLCDVGRYHTSAHADAVQVEQLVEAANPRKIALIHGEAHALNALRERLGKRRTVVLENEKIFEIKGRKRIWRGAALEPPAAEAILQPIVCAKRTAPTETEVRTLWERLMAVGEREYSEAEIARLFLGKAYLPSEREALAASLANHRLYFITGSRIGQRSYRPRPREELIDMMLERNIAYGIPLHRGDVVVFSDGSPDLYVAAVVQVDGDTVEAVIPFSSRTSFRRDWLRCKTALDLRTFVQTRPEYQVERWLEAVVREARALPALDPMDAYYVALAEGGQITVQRALEIFFPHRDGVYSSAMHLAAALCLANARALFGLSADGGFIARSREEAAQRWRAFRKMDYVRTLGDREIRLATGATVRPTGVYFADSFEARTEDGSYTRVSYRRVLLPGEEPPVVSEPGNSTSGSVPDRRPPRRKKRRGGNRRTRKQRLFAIIAEAEAALSATASAQQEKKGGRPDRPVRRRRRRGRRRAPTPRSARRDIVWGASAAENARTMHDTTQVTAA